MKSKENLETGKSLRMSTTSVVSINQIPLLNIFDMRKASSNMQLVRLGNVNKPEDLESQEVPDWKVKEVDLSIIEREVNRKKRKRAKA